MSKEKDMAVGILEGLGGKDNVVSITNCMTRLRVEVKDRSKVDKERLSAINGVIKVIDNGEGLQIVLGPGAAAKVAGELSKVVGIKLGDAREIKAAINEKNKTPFKLLLRRIAGIFIPLIPGLIGGGLILGITNVATKFEWIADKNLLAMLGVFGSTIFTYMGIMVGINTAKEFGGSPTIGGIIAGIIYNPALANIQIAGKPLIIGRGGIISVLIAAAFASYLERNIRKKMPNTIELLATPLLTILIAGFATLYVLQPVGGLIADAIGNAVNVAIAGKAGVFTGFVLAGTFLPLVMTGLHQGLTPIHVQLIESTGVTVLLPILAMAGAGQVGAALAVYVKTKSRQLKKIIEGSIAVGILGIGEPLIYGVTLPLGRPFIGACIGGAFGGAFQAFFGVGSKGLGISGIPLAALIQPEKIVYYLLGLAVSYIAGFIATYLLGFDDPVDERVNAESGFSFNI
ncbi:PTS transporter subunit EIIC [Thermoanaerobacterium sp. DL9XJH110]|uniref:PTS transporter subunit EIIC n=1 Tax=Thermoanaerobacterium sp. DL9XJH110 TaxID=3386643 RepID=UPI003BB556C4